MKRNIFLLLLVLFLASCGSNIELDTDKINKQLNENNQIVDVTGNLNNIIAELKQIGVTGEEFKKNLKEQEENYKKLANLKGTVRKKYILETEVLPKLLENSSITPSSCKTTQLFLYTKCMYINKVPLNKVLNEIPKELKDVFKNAYYHGKYITNKQELFKKTNDPIAITQKKYTLSQLLEVGVLSNSTICNKFPEKEVKDYCLSLFKK